MRFPCFVSAAVLVGVLAVGLGAPGAAAGQTAISESAMRTSWGDPNLEGVWNYSTLTPMERPSAFGDKRELTEEEAVAFAAAERQRQNRDLIDSAAGGLLYAPESSGGVVPYNEFWYDRGTTVITSTSLVIDPQDGRLPPMTPEAQRRAAAQVEVRRQEQRGNPRADGPEDRGLGNRCITRTLPRMPGPYNNNYHIVQAPDYVAILAEMNHDVRIIPLDRRPHLSQDLHQWLGDSRARWDGDTLVVETINMREASRGASPDAKLVERFTRAAADRIDYEVTVDDPATWTDSWTAAFPLTHSPEPVYEYACHEGNYSMETILAGARRDEIATQKAER
jgi:hypothetical protein